MDPCKKKNIPKSVNKFFKAPASRIFTCQVRKQLATNTERVRERGKKSPDWQVGLHFYSPILNFTHIWRVLISTPALQPKPFAQANVVILLIALKICLTHIF
jgi:hypothetical protein